MNLWQSDISHSRDTAELHLMSSLANNNVAAPTQWYTLVPMSLMHLSQDLSPQGRLKNQLKDLFAPIQAENPLMQNPFPF
ncbi:hypothetical protein QQF64_033777 [Cirrhinus molitorella]|uniref:Uncharacterized protein n=1 Tax=Cirrhinus molitorella TaxID=172907 RepID=A0ABR3MUU4_9TELE